MAQHLLSLWDFSREQLQAYIDLALQLKKESKTGIRHQHLSGRIIGLIFEKPSTRTRVSFEAAMYGLGGQVIYLSSKDTQLARNEPLKDMARVMARYVDGLVVRTFGQEIVDELAGYSSVPVINALTDLHHPCQILSDIMTVIEYRGPIADLKVTWIGDGNNMANSWIQAAGRFGFTLTLACPKGYEPNPKILAEVQQAVPGKIRLVNDPMEGVRDADVINTDVWASMGQEDEADSRLKVFQAFQVNEQLVKAAAKDAIVLHCLPAHREEEITDQVLESAQCVAFDQAENKLHIHKAILASHLG
ncbi:MAG: ornithine carbamoyltransferase [Proteobacteria bacterium]|nr:ornithine carbamoyltransferase [Pseudomonadota bacterium]MBU1687006.1 ornithine carbamoyltransferase [Pseudomonadota bacterium]